MIPIAYEEAFEITEITIGNEENLLPHDDIMIGVKAKAKLNELFEDEDITQACVTKKLTSATSLYKESLLYYSENEHHIETIFYKCSLG